VYVGEVITPNDMNDGEAAFPEFHSVYMDPESFAEYEKTGKYRDGTVLLSVRLESQREWEIGQVPRFADSVNLAPAHFMGEQHVRSRNSCLASQGGSVSFPL
jgi:hypothetical protein